MAGDPQAIKTRLAQAPCRIVPSILQCDFGTLADEMASTQAIGPISVQWDVMDGHFVNNFTYGPVVIESCRPHTDLIFDTHLMMSNPDQYLDQFLHAGCDIVTVHLEAVPEPGPVLDKIRAGGALAGLAINPPTPAEKLAPWLEHLDLILIMGVMPGFGGQSFDRSVLAKLEWAQKHAPPGTLIEVDGGVNRHTIADAAAAGARLFVVGSAFFTADDRQNEHQVLESLATNAISA